MQLKLMTLILPGINIEVGTYAQIISEELNYDGVDNIILAAKLHDIGKISIPSHILNKPGRLTEEEYEIIKNQIPTEGYKIIDNIEYFNEIKHGVKYHHEHWRIWMEADILMV